MSAKTFASQIDISSDLLGEIDDSRKRALLPQSLEKLQLDAFAIDVPIEVEQVRLDDAPTLLVQRRPRADVRDRFVGTLERRQAHPAGVDAVLGKQGVLEHEIRRSKPQLSPNAFTPSDEASLWD